MSPCFQTPKRHFEINWPLKPQSISISKLRKKLGTNNNKENISWCWIKKDLQIIEEYQIFSTGHLQKNPVELFQYFFQKRLSVIRLQKYELISIVLQKLVTRRPSVKLFRQNSRIRYKRENHWSWAHFLTFPIVKERKWNKKKSFWTIRGTLSSWGVVELSLEIGQSHFSSWWSLFVFIDGGT